MLWNACHLTNSLPLQLALLSPQQSASVQPLRLGPEAVREPNASPNYWDEVRPLLVDMNTTFTALAVQLAGLRSQIPQNANITALFDDISDAMWMVALRASSVLGMYDYSASWLVPIHW